MQSCHWDNNEEWSPNIFLLSQVSQQSNCLNSLSKTHLICQDTINTLVVEIIKPLESFELVCLKVSFEHFWLLNRDINCLRVMNFIIIQIIFIDFISIMVIKVIKSFPILID